MNNLGIVGVAAGAALVAFTALPVRQAETGSAQPLMRVAETACFKKSEEVSGFNRICYYECGLSTYAITVKSSEMCPMEVHR
jgi:hypothetical protein